MTADPVGRLGSWCLLPVLLLVLACTTGCPPKVSERTHAKYELGAPFKFRPATPGGIYEVKWSETEDGPRTTIEHTRREVREGELLGFSLEEGGQLIAIAGEARVPISPIPSGARYFVWSTQFVKDDPKTKPYALPE